jgi:hypothetical protein
LQAFREGGVDHPPSRFYSVLTDRNIHITAELLSPQPSNFAWFRFVLVGARFTPATSVVLASFVKERFRLPVRSGIFRFLHLPMSEVIVPRTITSMTNEIKSVSEPAL